VLLCLQRASVEFDLVGAHALAASVNSVARCLKIVDAFRSGTQAFQPSVYSSIEHWCTASISLSLCGRASATDSQRPHPAAVLAVRTETLLCAYRVLLDLRGQLGACRGMRGASLVDAHQQLLLSHGVALAIRLEHQLANAHARLGLHARKVDAIHHHRRVGRTARRSSSRAPRTCTKPARVDLACHDVSLVG